MSHSSRMPSPSASPHARSLPSPDHAWARVKPLTILDDRQVNQWLARNAPDAARELGIEARRMHIQSECESGGGLEATAMCSWFGGVSEPFECSNGRHYTLLGLPDRHYLFALFPDCGRVEICETVKPALPKSHHRALCLTFGLGYDAARAAREMGLCRDTVVRYLSKCRALIVRSVAEVEGTGTTEGTPPGLDVAAIFHTESRRNIDTRDCHPYRGVFRKTISRAYVCDCGRHVNWRRKTHRKNEAAPAVYACPCGRRYTDAERRALIA